MITLATLLEKKLSRLTPGTQVELTYDCGDALRKKVIGTVVDNDNEESIEVLSQDGTDLILNYCDIKMLSAQPGGQRPAPEEKREEEVRPSRKPLYEEAPEDMHLVYTCRRPLEIVLRRALKKSDNLCAEALFRHLGLKNGKTESHLGFEESQQVVNRFMRNAIGFSPDNYKIVDGSGVSMYNYVSPELVLAYLNYAYRHSEFFDMFYDGLPIAGMDGTLRYRMGRGSTFRNVHAKTGTVTGVCSLAGYVTAKNGHLLSFVIINQNVLKSRLARKFQDEVCELLSEFD